MGTERMRRVDEAMREVLSAALSEDLKDPRVGFVTVTDVKTSPDLRHARVFVSVLGDATARAATLDGLRSAHGFLQGRIGRRAAHEAHAHAGLRLRRHGRAGGPPRSHHRPPRGRALMAATEASGTVEDTRRLLLDELRTSDRFVLVTHEHPDGDALGSLVAMHRVLRALGKDSVMLMDADEFPLPYEYRFFDLDGLQSVPPQDLDERTVIFLDCGNIDRNPLEVVKRAGTHILNIDHHHDNTRFGTIDHVVVDASCTAEIVWDLMRGLGVAPTLEVAEALYVGLVTDTGKFMYENTGRRAHLMAAELIEAGVDVHGIYRRLYEDMPYAKLELLGRALANLQRDDDGALTFSRLSRDDFRLAGAEESYSEGIIDHLRSVEAHEGRRAGARAGQRGGQRPQEGLAARHRRQRRRLRSSRAPRAAAGTARRPASRRASATTSCGLPARAGRRAALGSPPPPPPGRDRAARAAIMRRPMDGLSSSTSPRARRRTTSSLAGPPRRWASGAARATPARSTRSRPACCSSSSAARRASSASSWRCPRPTRPSRAGRRVDDRRPGGRARRRPASGARGPPRAAHRPPAPAPAGLQRGPGRRPPRLRARARRGGGRGARARGRASTASRSSGARATARASLIECSSGTYVRSLVADLGDAYCLGAAAHGDRPVRRRRRRPARASSPLGEALAFLPAVAPGRRDGPARRPRAGGRAPAHRPAAGRGPARSTPTARSRSPSPREGAGLKPVVGFRGPHEGRPRSPTPSRRPRRVAVGTFDGVHLGHREVIAGADTVLTFEPHPLSVVAPGRHAAAADDARAQGRAASASCGVEELVVIAVRRARSPPAARRASSTTCSSARSAPPTCRVGENFRFGHKAQGDPALLAADGRFETRVVAAAGGRRRGRQLEPHPRPAARRRGRVRRPAARRAVRRRRRGRPRRRARARRSASRPRTSCPPDGFVAPGPRRLRRPRADGRRRPGTPPRSTSACARSS